MTSFSAKVSALSGVAEEQLGRVAGGDLSEVLLLNRSDGRRTIAKGGPAVGTEAAMLRALASAGVPVPMVEGEHEGVLLLEYIENDGVFSANAWADVGNALRMLHGKTGRQYGWPADYRLGTVALNNRQTSDWPAFWGEQRLVTTASILDRPTRDRIERLTKRLPELLPGSPSPSFLHGDLWTGNILVHGGRLAALIDPACYGGHCEVDLAMLTFFETPPDEFWEAYGSLEQGWEERRILYQLFPALVHLRLFGSAYAGMVDRLLQRMGC